MSLCALCQMIDSSGAEMLRQLVRGCRRVDIVEKCGHLVALDQPRPVANLLVDFRRTTSVIWTLQLTLPPCSSSYINIYSPVSRSICLYFVYFVCCVWLFGLFLFRLIFSLFFRCNPWPGCAYIRRVSRLQQGVRFHHQQWRQNAPRRSLHGPCNWSMPLGFCDTAIARVSALYVIIETVFHCKPWSYVTWAEFSCLAEFLQRAAVLALQALY